MERTRAPMCESETGRARPAPSAAGPLQEIVRELIGDLEHPSFAPVPVEDDEGGQVAGDAMEQLARAPPASATSRQEGPELSTVAVRAALDEKTEKPEPIGAVVERRARSRVAERGAPECAARTRSTRRREPSLRARGAAPGTPLRHRDPPRAKGDAGPRRVLIRAQLAIRQGTRLVKVRAADPLELGWACVLHRRRERAASRSRTPDKGSTARPVCCRHAP